MTTREAIRETASFFIEKGENPSETDIRLTLNDLVGRISQKPSASISCRRI